MCADELSPIAQSEKTRAVELSPMAQVGNTCADELSPIAHPRKTYEAHCSSFSAKHASTFQEQNTNSPSEKRDHGDNRSYERPTDWTARRESRQYTNIPLVPVNAAKTVSHGAVLVELSAGVHGIKTFVARSK